MKSTTEATPRHGAEPLYLTANDCGHPEPDRDGPGWGEWDDAHLYSLDGERLCVDAPVGTYCRACSEVAADSEDPSPDDYVACRETAAAGETSETPAETMRRAAKHMREHAGLVPPPPWYPAVHDVTTHDGLDVIASSGLTVRAQYIASMHPGVARVLADLLDEIARQYDAPPCDSPAGVCNGCERREDFNDAERLAWAYLGETAAATGAAAV